MSTVTQLELVCNQILTGQHRRAVPRNRFYERRSDGLASVAMLGLSLMLAFETFHS